MNNAVCIIIGCGSAVMHKSRCFLDYRNSVLSVYHHVYFCVIFANHTDSISVSNRDMLINNNSIEINWIFIKLGKRPIIRQKGSIIL